MKVLDVMYLWPEQKLDAAPADARYIVYGIEHLALRVLKNMLGPDRIDRATTYSVFSSTKIM